MIEIENLRVARNGSVICAVDQLEVDVGARLAVIGPNGSGKTTLLRVLAGLETNYTGDCRVAVPHGSRTYVHQQPYLFRGTALDNVCYRAEAKSQAWSERLGLASLMQRDAATLSGGERRRVALARALAVDPQLLLLDEPLAELDDVAAGRVVEVLSEIDATVVIASPTDLPAELASVKLELPTTNF